MRKPILSALILAMVSVFTFTASADELENATQQKNYIDSQKNDINRLKSAEQNKKNSLEKEKTNIANTQAKVQKEVQQTAGELQKANNEVKVIETAVKESEEKYNQQKELFKTRLRVMYENSRNSYIHTLVQSKSLTDFFAKLELMSMISKRDKELVKSLEATKKDVEYKKKLKEDEKKAKEQQLAEKQKTMSSLQISRAQKEEEIRKTNSSIAKYEEQENALARKSEELTNTIKNLKRRGGKYAGGSMTWPVPSSDNITSPFGNRYHPVLKKYRMHTGIDISAGSGQSIVSANKGTVILSGWQDGYGNTVIVDHGGDIVTLYAHCSRLLVSEGDEVGAGDVIAKIGSTGLSTGPHLHFEVRKDGEPIDPMGYVGGN